MVSVASFYMPCDIFRGAIKNLLQVKIRRKKR
uniref:Ocellatin family protein n=1 Tax=Myoviridae sp. ct31P9 TaxID=2827657 RepID=A0A8S5T3D1_9CAUD|nr:MAG TPA: Ocellatin family protein [Myoviridae sp. ct31P9]